MLDTPTVGQQYKISYMGRPAEVVVVYVDETYVYVKFADRTVLPVYIFKWHGQLV